MDMFFFLVEVTKRKEGSVAAFGTFIHVVQPMSDWSPEEPNWVNSKSIKQTEGISYFHIHLPLKKEI